MENEKEIQQIMKPMSVARAEFINSLTDLINNCMLPPFVIEAVLKDRYADLRAVSQEQLKQDYKKYQEALNQQQGNQTEQAN